MYSITEIAEIINIPTYDWAGSCHAIATQMVKHGFVDGYVERGHWLGPVSKKSLFYGKPIVPHSWIQLSDGIIIVDPTRFAFEGVDPYIWKGTDIENYYDAGGNSLRKAIMQPCPKFNPSSHAIQLVIDPVSAQYIQKWTGSVSNTLGCLLSVDQVFWLANMPLDLLGLAAKPVYTSIIDAGFSAAIPIDNRNRVMR